MADRLRVAVIGDFNSNFPSHRATNDSLRHAADRLPVDVDVQWLPTASLLDSSSTERLDRFDGLWASPGSPYQSMEGALRGIQFARERGRPFVGT